MDDTLFVIEGSKENAEAIKLLLKNYEIGSGLQVKFDKSNIFGVNMDPQNGGGSRYSRFSSRVAVSSVFGAKSWRQGKWHRGQVGSCGKGESAPAGCDAQSLSMGGRVTIINSNLKSMPLYCISFRPLPSKVANQLTSLQRNFLWDGNMKSKKMAWLKWDVICKPKYEGGLGVKNLQLFNIALLSKWI